MKNFKKGSISLIVMRAFWVWNLTMNFRQVMKSASSNTIFRMEIRLSS